MHRSGCTSATQVRYACGLDTQWMLTAVARQQMTIYAARGCLGTTLYACLFFFFQAEDGIRDVAVTGVQTCALPISPDALGEHAANVAVGFRRVEAQRPHRV